MPFGYERKNEGNEEDERLIKYPEATKLEGGTKLLLF